MSDSLRRALRTLIQSIGAAGLVALYEAFSPWTLTLVQEAALLTVLVPLVSFAVNALEEGGTNIPGLTDLKRSTQSMVEATPTDA